MKVEIRDKDKNILKALNLIGFKINSFTLEVVLNIAEHVKERGAKTTISEITEIEEMVKSLYED